MDQLNVRYNLLDANNKKMPALDLAESVTAFEQLVNGIQTQISLPDAPPLAVYVSADVKQECVEISFLIEVVANTLQAAGDYLNQWEVAKQIAIDTVGVVAETDWTEYLNSLLNSQFNDPTSVSQPPLSVADIQQLAKLYRELRGSGVVGVKTIRKDGNFVGFKIKVLTHNTEFEISTQNLRLLYLATNANIRKHLQEFYAPLGMRRERYQDMMLRSEESEPIVINAEEYKQFDHTDHSLVQGPESPPPIPPIKSVLLNVQKVVWEGRGRWSFRPEKLGAHELPSSFDAKFSGEASIWLEEYFAGKRDLKPNWLLEVEITVQPKPLAIKPASNRNTNKKTNKKTKKKAKKLDDRKANYDYIITKVLSSRGPSQQESLPL